MSSGSKNTTERTLPDRYEIRPLGPEHADWAAAILCHSNVFHSTVFPVVYPEGQTARFNAAMKAAGYLVDHQIQSGLSFGVFDKQFPFKRPESASAPAGGKFYWDHENDVLTSEEVLDAMDFPLVSIALAYDGVDKLDFQQLLPLIASLPIFGTIYHALDERDPRAPQSWREPAGRNTLLMRNATSTRRECEGQGLMGILARYLMRTAAERGFKMANIECVNDAVTHVWSNPPAPFKGEIVAQFRTEEYREKDEATGQEVNPFHPAKQLVTRVCTTLA